MKKSQKVWIYICLALAVCCMGYGLVVGGARSGGKFYLIWLAVAIGFVLLAGMIRLQVWGRFPKALQKVLLVLLTAGVLLFITVEGCIISGFSAKGEPDLNYLIVLGAQMRQNGPSIVLKYRLDTACAYLKENPQTICIVSGGQGKNESCSEAQGMQEYLVEHGIEEERIIKEAKSTSTVENIIYSADIIGDKDVSIGIVTNNFHIFRGVKLARHAGFKNVCGISAPSHPAFLPNNMFREFFGVLKDIACRNM